MMWKKNTLLGLVVLITLSGVSTAFTSSDISLPVVKIACGLYTGFKLVAGALGVLILVYSGVEWLTKTDEPAARKAAKENVKLVIIGMLIIILADTVIWYAVEDTNMLQCSSWCLANPALC